VHSHWSAWKFLRSRLKPHLNIDNGVPSHLRADNSIFKLYWMLSTIANSPAATVLFSLMAIIMLAFFASVSAISRALAISQDHHDHRHNATT
jgi:hypothetical protein